MKIEIVADGPQISANIKYMLQLFSRLKKREEVSFNYLAYEGRLDLKTKEIKELKAQKVPFFDYFFNFGLYYPIKTVFESEKSNIIHFSRHYPFFIFWHKFFTKNKIVVTSHDLYNLNPNYLIFLKNMLKMADKVITVSNASKEELLKLGIKNEKIKVIYHGVNNKIFKPINKIKAFKLLRETKFANELGPIKKNSKVILNVANDTKRKNTERIYLAFEKFLEKNPNSYLIRVVSILNEEIIKTQKERFKEKIIFLSGLSDEEMSYLYNISDFLVFPSICEGFGFPLLESISCGTPCVTSNFRPMTEVVGDSGILVNPYDVNSIYLGMVKCFKNRGNLSKKSLKRSRSFSIEKNFKETHNVYKSLLNSK